MLRVGPRFWCLVYIALIVSVPCLGLPTTSPSLATLLRNKSLAVQPASATGERVRTVKRSTRLYRNFYRMMQRHARYLGQQAFMERMFRLFDMNGDNLIVRNEFRAIIRLLGFLSQ